MNNRHNNISIVLEQPFDVNGGGVQRSTSKLAEIFSDKGYNVSIISTSMDNNKVGSYNGMAIHYCNDLKTLKAVFEKEKTSIVINQAGYSLSLTKKILRASSALKVINTLRINPSNFKDNHKQTIGKLLKKNGLSILDHNFVYKMILKYHIFKQRYELGYIIKHTDAFVMLSERFKEELYQLVPSVEKYDHKIFGINNPFEVPAIQISELQKKDVILHVGRLEINQKRVDLLLEIWQMLHIDLPEWEFWVVGYGAEAQNMKSYCKEHSLDRVKFFGKQKPDSYYKQAKIFHLTSAFEGFGNVLVEAQSYGCVPVLFDSYSAASEIINHKEDGCLVHPFDVEKYVAETLNLALQQKVLYTMRLNAYENAKRFDYDKTYDKWEEVFDFVDNGYV